MKLWFPVRVCEAFPFPLPSRYVDGIRGPSFQSFVEGALHSKIEVVTAAH